MVSVDVFYVEDYLIEHVEKCILRNKELKMERLEKFKIAFTLKHPSVYDDSILNELYINFDDKYIDELISKFDYREYEIKSVIKKNIETSSFLQDISYCFLVNKSDLISNNLDQFNLLVNSIYIEINNYINKRRN